MELIGGSWELICICFGLFVNALGLLYNVFRYVRAGGLRRVGDWQEMLAVLRRFECEAEGIVGLDGAGKLEYVLSKMREYSESLGQSFDRDLLDTMVTKDVSFANEMNAIKRERLE